jgi:hypothetical protein
VVNKKAKLGELMKKSFVDALKEAFGGSVEKTKTEPFIGARLAT